MFALICVMGGIVSVSASETQNLALGSRATHIVRGQKSWVTGLSGTTNNAWSLPTAESVKNTFGTDLFITGTGLYWGKCNGNGGDDNDFKNLTTNGFDFIGRQAYTGEWVAQVYELEENVHSINVSFEVQTTSIGKAAFSVWTISGGVATQVAASERTWNVGAQNFEATGLSLTSGNRVVFIWTSNCAGEDVHITNYSARYNASSEDLQYSLTNGTSTWSSTYQGVKGVSVPAFTGAYGMTLTNGRWEDDTYKATVNFPFPVDKPATIMSALGTTSYLYGKESVVKADPKGGNDEILPTDGNGADYLWNIIPVFDGTSVSFKLKNVGKGSYISSSDAALVDFENAGKFTYSETGISSGIGFRVLGTTTDQFLNLGSSQENNKTIEIWAKSGSKHVGANLSFRDIRAEFDALPKEKFDLVDGATVISPTEYAAPSVINAAIDAAADCGTDAEKVAFLLGSDATELTKFKSASTQHGNPISFTYTIKGGKWGTLFSQVNFKKPAEWTLYQCSAHTTGGELTLTEFIAGENKNKPYLVKTTATEEKTYQIIGYASGAATVNTKIGLLTGVIEKNTKIPENSYILASKDGVQAFHKVTTGAMDAQVNKAFLTITDDASARSIIFIEDEATSINEIFGAEESVANNGKFVENGKVIIVKNGVKYNIAGQIVK